MANLREGQSSLAEGEVRHEDCTCLGSDGLENATRPRRYMDGVLSASWSTAIHHPVHRDPPSQKTHWHPHRLTPTSIVTRPDHQTPPLARFINARPARTPVLTATVTVLLSPTALLSPAVLPLADPLP